MFGGLDTRDSVAVEREVREVFRALFPSASPGTPTQPDEFIPRCFSWIRDCFLGRHPGYQAIDVAYHDFEHTLQGTLCLTRLLQGRHRAGVAPPLTPRWFELALLGILFHDTGYLKTTSDRSGTGAKYTPVHVGRGADFAAAFLSPRGYSVAEITSIQNMIRCTGLNADLAALPFGSDLERDLGLALATADLVGQLAADDYVDKLPLLFSEFEESARANPDAASRMTRFATVEDLVRNTPGFWEHYVKVRLDRDFRRAYRHLGTPNPYLVAIEANMARLKGGLPAAARRP
ncbi:MAG TPA: hypothetical protein DCM86_04390 [Verrucomicrobiales bacterium]|nr:hypothetical protein [Verrucomicrobiales bacterium]